MGIVAIGAVDGSFVHAVFERHRELSADGSVTGITQIGLALGQQEFRRRCLVDGMAVGAHNVVPCVGGLPDICSRNGLRMTTQAVVEGLPGGQDRECDDLRLAGSFRMFPPGAMTSLATGVFRRIFRQRDALVVRVLIKVQPNVRMTGSAHLTSNVARRQGWFWRRRREGRLSRRAEPCKDQNCGRHP